MSLLHYETYHHSPAAEWICMIHGAGGSTRTWYKQKDDLVRRFNLILVDLPGHGKSRESGKGVSEYTFEFLSEKVWNVVDHLEVGRVHLMGVSLGSIVAMQMEQLRPAKVLSITMAGAIVELQRKLRIVARCSLAIARVIGYRAFYRFAAWVALPKANHKKSRKIFVRESNALSIEEFKKWTAMYDKCLDSTLKKLYNSAYQSPILLVMGEEDHLFLESAKRFVLNRTNASIEIFQKCGHLVSLEKSSLYNQVSERFLKGVEQMNDLMNTIKVIPSKEDKPSTKK